MDTPNLDNSITPKVQPASLTEERVRSLYRGVPLSIGVTLVLVLLLTLSHWNIIGQGDLILWNILMLCAMFLRTVNWFIWRNRIRFFLNLFVNSLNMRGCICDRNGFVFPIGQDMDGDEVHFLSQLRIF